MRKSNIFSNYSFFWVTLILFLGSLIGHWTFGWFAFKQEQLALNQPVLASDFLVEVMRDTLENWQSEFLQLIWQVAGLAYLLHLGSPQSKEGDERKEEKLDKILQAVAPQDASRILAELDQRFPRK